MNNNIVSKILVVLGTIIVLVGTVSFVLNMQNEDVKIVTDNTHSDFKDNKNDYNVNISLLKNEKNNSDVYGVLRVDTVELYTILTKTYNNKFYLNHNIKGNKSESGNPFIDYRNESLDDKEIVVYGNSNNKEFNKLTKLFNRDTFNKDTTIDLYLEDGKTSYELKMVKISEVPLDEDSFITKDTEVITTYTDSTDTIENIEVDNKKVENKEENKEEIKEENTVEENKEEKEEDLSNTLYSNLYSNSKYCKNNCIIEDDEDVLVIEILNEKSPAINMILIATKKQ